MSDRNRNTTGYYKRPAVIMLCLLVFIALPFAVFADDGPVAISTPEELIRIAEDPDGSYVLSADLDMSGIDWEPLAFFGSFDGAGHTIYNLKVTRVGSAHADTLCGNSKVYDSVFAGFFSVLEGAEVKDLTLRGVAIDVESSIHCFAAGFTGYIRDSLISGCSITDARIKLTPTCGPEEGSSRKSCNAGVGGIAGFGSGTIEDCKADVVLIFDDHCDSALKVEEFMGGIVSNGNVVANNVDIVIDGYCACSGYVHNGGLVGMFFQFDKSEPVGRLDYCSVSGMISFYENNKDRRAYCKADIGERMAWPYVTHFTESFTRNELKDYSWDPSPEQCDEPSVTDTVLPGDCSTWGYTLHSCSGCGHSWTDTFTPPFHVPGEWKVVTEAANGTDGLKQKNCTVCGLLLEEAVLPALKEITLDNISLQLDYKDGCTLNASPVPSDSVNAEFFWSSSDESVATVDEEGKVYAAGRGTAVITCESADGFAKSSCEVNVDYTFKQWLIKILLFGWIWY